MAVEAVKTEPGPEPEKEHLGLDSLTAAESAMAERKAAQSIATLGNDNFPQVGLLGALGWVLARRGDVKLTYEAYMGSRTLNQITEELALTTPDDEDEEAEGKDAG
jgi:hypothetical protein